MEGFVSFPFSSQASRITSIIKPFYFFSSSKSYRENIACVLLGFIHCQCFLSRLPLSTFFLATKDSLLITTTDGTTGWEQSAFENLPKRIRSSPANCNVSSPLLTSPGLQRNPTTRRRASRMIILSQARIGRIAYRRTAASEGVRTSKRYASLPILMFSTFQRPFLICRNRRNPSWLAPVSRFRVRM